MSPSVNIQRLIPLWRWYGCVWKPGILQMAIGTGKMMIVHWNREYRIFSHTLFVIGLVSDLQISLGCWCAFNLLASKRVRATAACTFWTAQLPKVLRGWCALKIFTLKRVRATAACLFEQLNCQKFCEPQVLFYVLTWTCVSHHSSSNFSLCSCSFLKPPDGSTTAALASLLINPPGPKTLEKQSFASRCFYLFARFDLLSSDSLVSDSFRTYCFICLYCRKFYF